MLKIDRKNSFKKDFELVKRRHKDMEKFKEVINLLINEQPLPAKYHDHNLRGNYNGCRECHIEPDWLLIYQKLDDALILIRTGTHSDLFK